MAFAVALALSVVLSAPAAAAPPDVIRTGGPSGPHDPMQGKFVSKQKAKAKLYLPAVCDGKGGKVTLELE